MNCSNCDYLKSSKYYKYCDITHRVNPKGCEVENIEDIPNMRICYNCSNWRGGGDWGLSCSIIYNLATTDGFRTACEKFQNKLLTSL